MKLTKKKILRWLGIDKPIELTEYENDLMCLSKGWIVKNATTWLEAAKPVFEKHYGWSPDDDEQNYKKVLLCGLFDLYLKVARDRSGSNRQLTGILLKTCYQGIFSDHDEPVDRVISEIFSLLSSNLVLEDGVHRYHLTKPKNLN